MRVCSCRKSCRLSFEESVFVGDGVLSRHTLLPAFALLPRLGLRTSFSISLLLQRDNGTNGQPLVSANSSGPLAGQTLISSTSPQFSTAPGIRTFFGRHGPDNIGWEVGYVGLYGMFGDAEAGGVDLLTVTPPLGNSVRGWSRADYARATYASNFDMVQANVFRYDCCREQDCSSRYPWNRTPSCHCIDWIAGVVWAGLEETAALNVTCCEGDPPSAYRNGTSSQIARCLGRCAGPP